MGRYQIRPWLIGFVIRDTVEGVYIRDWAMDVVVYSLGDAAESCLRMNQLDREREWEMHCDAMGTDPYGSDTFDDDGYRDDDYPGFEEDYQTTRYGLVGMVDADDYSAQYC